MGSDHLQNRYSGAAAAGISGLAKLYLATNSMSHSGRFQDSAGYKLLMDEVYAAQRSAGQRTENKQEEADNVKE